MRVRDRKEKERKSPKPVDKFFMDRHISHFQEVYVLDPSSLSCCFLTSHFASRPQQHHHCVYVPVNCILLKAFVSMSFLVTCTGFAIVTLDKSK